MVTSNHSFLKLILVSSADIRKEVVKNWSPVLYRLSFGCFNRSKVLIMKTLIKERVTYPTFRFLCVFYCYQSHWQEFNKIKNYSYGYYPVVIHVSTDDQILSIKQWRIFTKKDSQRSLYTGERDTENSTYR